MAPPPPPPSPPKPLSNLFYKSLLIIIFIALLPLFPSRAPDYFINHSIFTRSWELLHLLVVGITVSYGLFSRRNNDHDLEKDLIITSSKPDTPTSYISKLLHVSSVFDDDDDDDNHNKHNNNNNNNSNSNETYSKVQAWSSQYSQAEPVVMKRATGESFKESVVLPSPIPWRSRSGRMQGVSMESKEKEKEKEVISHDSSILKKKKSSSLSVTPPPPPPPPPPLPTSVTGVGKSVRTFRSVNKNDDFVEHYKMKKDVGEKVMVVESDDDTDDDDDDDDDVHVKGEIEEIEEEKRTGSGVEVEEEVEDEHEVDKKADEFIAKFREQIRLQRIESIKKSSGQRSPKSP